MRLFRLVLILVCIVSVAFAFPARAWEFSMEGRFTSTYEYYMGPGAAGFFGPFNQDASIAAGGLLPGDFASLNGWVGPRTREIVSGSDSTQNYVTLELFPDIRINSAIRFQAKYRLGDYGNPVASDYLTNTRSGIDVATSDGQWTMWWVTANLPWGTFVVGKRLEAFGTGLQYNGEDNNTTEGLGLVSSYGPFRIICGVRPYWQLFGETTPYYNVLDKSGIRQLSVMSAMTYREGNLDMGVFAALLRWHAGPESQSIQAIRNTFTAFDETWRNGTVYAKYQNGTFFLNNELAYFDIIVKRCGTPNRGPQYNESWRYMAELGACYGPGKLSFLYAFMPGPDRRAGVRINKQPFIQLPPFGAYGVFKPYSYLLNYGFAGGVNAQDLNRNGYINDATVLASRLDFAVAANLNLFGTFLWAERNSHGYGWGYIRPAQRSSVSRVLNTAGVPQDRISWTPTVTYADNTGAPSIPDRALGWEITGGFNWMLLENYTLGLTVAYWKPGKWFNHACVDKTVPGWNVPTAANNWGTNPGRDINRVIGGEVKLTVDF